MGGGAWAHILFYLFYFPEVKYFSILSILSKIFLLFSLRNKIFLYFVYQEIKSFTILHEIKSFLSGQRSK